MEKLPIVPYPNHVEFLGGTVQITPEFPITIIKTSDSRNDEGYELKISSDGIFIRAARSAGIFYAKQTLKQLSLLKDVPCVLIRDEPEFAYRGFMLDSVRHMTSFEEIKKLIDAAAFFKLNTLHWHLTDDQGWRVEIDSWKNLVEVGSKRAHSEFGKENDRAEYGGYFTKAQMREIVEYCSERSIEVIPEIDLPGHTLAILASYPEFSCTHKSFEVGTKQGIYSDILCAGNDKVFDLIFDVLREIIEIFPSKLIHIGGDEAPKKRWKKCPLCRQRIKQLGLHDEEELQGWFMKKIADFLKNNGRQSIVWNESLKSGFIKDELFVERWIGKKSLSINYANNGGKLIMSDFYNYYLDYPYAMTPLKKTYNYNPFMNGLSESGKKNILGVETAIWTEYICDFDKMCYMCYPRAAAVAETGWTNPQNKNLDGFYERFIDVSPLLNEIGIFPAPQSDWNPRPLKKLGTLVKFFKNLI